MYKRLLTSGISSDLITARNTAKTHDRMGPPVRIANDSAFYSNFPCEICIVNLNYALERAYIIRRPTPDSYVIYLLDKGLQGEAKFDDIYEIPPEMQNIGLFCCICPIEVPTAYQRDHFVRSAVVGGYARGRLLVEKNGNHEELQHIVNDTQIVLD
ncbi:unnamed protein product [Gongylonema pulchrum]|uniref:CMP/dCMP-type deaminase domain-containing protein n=1 Tax=Gongylonema pulchrum TaxID=637853 RepID=A0A183DUJ2_9BILA|nr:unnamed protein product [Gongylonema pulchrum]